MNRKMIWNDGLDSWTEEELLCMKYLNVCYGKGGGSAPPPPSSVQQSTTAEFPTELRPFVSDIFEKSQAIQEQRQEEGYQPELTQQLASFTPEQEASFQGIQNVVGQTQPLFDEATTLARQSGRAATDPAEVAALMNPFLRNVTDIQKREAQRVGDVQEQQLAAQASQAGAFGGSRAAILEAERQRNLSQQLGDIEAQGLAASFQNAQNQLQNQFGRESAAAAQLGALGAAIPAQQFKEFGALSGIGAAKQQQAQRAFDIATQQAREEYGFPMATLQDFSSILRGFPLPATQNVSRQSFSPAQPLSTQLLGLGTGLAGLAGAAGAFKKAGGLVGAPVGMKNGGYVKLAGGGGLGQMMQEKLPSNRVRMGKTAYQDASSLTLEEFIMQNMPTTSAEARAFREHISAILMSKVTSREGEAPDMDEAQRLLKQPVANTLAPSFIEESIQTTRSLASDPTAPADIATTAIQTAGGAGIPTIPTNLSSFLALKQAHPELYERPIYPAAPSTTESMDVGIAPASAPSTTESMDVGIAPASAPLKTRGVSAPPVPAAPSLISGGLPEDAGGGMRFANAAKLINEAMSTPASSVAPPVPAAASSTMESMDVGIAPPPTPPVPQTDDDSSLRASLKKAMQSNPLNITNFNQLQQDRPVELEDPDGIGSLVRGNPRINKFSLERAANSAKEGLITYPEDVLAGGYNAMKDYRDQVLADRGQTVSRLGAITVPAENRPRDLNPPSPIKPIVEALQPMGAAVSEAFTPRPVKLMSVPDSVEYDPSAIKPVEPDSTFIPEVANDLAEASASRQTTAAAAPTKSAPTTAAGTVNDPLAGPVLDKELDKGRPSPGASPAQIDYNAKIAEFKDKDYSKEVQAALGPAPTYEKGEEPDFASQKYLTLLGVSARILSSNKPALQALGDAVQPAIKELSDIGKEERKIQRELRTERNTQKRMDYQDKAGRLKMQRDLRGDDVDLFTKLAGIKAQEESNKISKQNANTNAGRAISENAYRKFKRTEEEINARLKNRGQVKLGYIDKVLASARATAAKNLGALASFGQVSDAKMQGYFDAAYKAQLPSILESIDGRVVDEKGVTVPRERIMKLLGLGATPTGGGRTTYTAGQSGPKKQSE